MIGVVMPAANVPYYLAIQKGFEAELTKQKVAVVPLVVQKPAPKESKETGWTSLARNIPYYSAIQEGVKAVLVGQGMQVLEMAVQRPAPNAMSRKNSARTLLALEPALILTYGTGTTMAALSETHDLPIVFGGAFDPAGVGATGKNITGMEAKVPLKVLVNHLQKMTNFTKLGVIFSSDEVDSVQQATAVADLGVKIVKIDAVQGADSIVLPPDVQAVLLTCAGVVQDQKAIARIVEKARTAKIATASVLGESAELGILISMTADVEQQAQELAKLVMAVLSGASPSSLPVVSGNKVDLTVNLAEAEVLGLTVPFEVIATAKVIK